MDEATVNSDMDKATEKDKKNMHKSRDVRGTLLAHLLSHFTLIPAPYRVPTITS